MISLFSTPKEPVDYDDEYEEEEEEMPPTKKTFELKKWRPNSSYPGGGDSKGSSDYFRKFASKNAGGSFRDEIHCCSDQFRSDN